MYETFYKLDGIPFQLNPDPQFYFPSKGHRRAFAYLKYGVYQGDGFIVITGEIGAGKTTMVRTLLEELDSQKIVAAQLMSTQLDADDLLHSVASAFGLPNQGLSKADLLANFEAFLSEVEASGRRALLVVDEAQNLTPRAMEELRMLSNYQRGARALLQSFLVGQPELRDILRSPTMVQLRQRIIASYHLGPMDRDETRAYVLHRLKHVGWNEDPRIEEGIYERLHAVTGGLPRLINAVCHRLFLGASMNERHVIGGADLNETINEMRDEISPEGPLAAAAGATRSPVAGAGTAVVRPFLLSAVVSRLDRIEKTVANAVRLLEDITGEDAKRIAASPKATRLRFGGRPPGR
jgi:putative secretion ATPase (PEP-CTERM system associated)